MVLRTDPTTRAANVANARADERAVHEMDRVQLARDLAVSLGTPVELRVSGGTTAVPPYLAYPGGEVVRLDVTGRPETVDDAVQRLPRHVQNELREYLGRPDVRDRLELLHEAEIEALVDFGAGVAELSNNLNRYQGYLAHQWVTRPDPPENAAGTSRLGADLSTGIEPPPAAAPPAGPVDPTQPAEMARAWLDGTAQQRAQLMAGTLATLTGYTVQRPTRNRPTNPPPGSRIVVVAGSAVAAGVVLSATQLRLFQPAGNRIGLGNLQALVNWAESRADDGEDIWYVVLQPAPPAGSSNP